MTTDTIFLSMSLIFILYLIEVSYGASCNVTALEECENMRIKVEEDHAKFITLFIAEKAKVETMCEAYKGWKSCIDPIHDDCKHVTSIESYSFTSHTNTDAVSKFVCDDQQRYDDHKDCIKPLMKYIDTCKDMEFNKPYDKMIEKKETISTLMDTSCDNIDKVLRCIRNVTMVQCQNSTAAGMYAEDFYKETYRSYMVAYDCRFERSWGYIIIGGILAGLLVLVACVWMSFWLCCKYCCGKCCKKPASMEDEHQLNDY